MSSTNPQVDVFFAGTKTWREEMEKLRGIILKFPLTEELKWGKPCYVYEGANVLIIQGFKEHCALLFTKGALLNDPDNVLKKPGENTQGARRMEFTGAAQIKAPVLKAYIQQAIDAEKAGLQVKFKKEPDPVPAELESAFAKNAALKRAFGALTPGRQRAYILFFNGARQSKTREARIEKSTPDILAGRGWNER